MSDHPRKSTKRRSAVALEQVMVADRAPPVTEEQGSVDVQIRLRAYELYIERGAQPGNDLTDWLRAEREFREASEHALA